MVLLIYIYWLVCGALKNVFVYVTETVLKKCLVPGPIRAVHLFSLSPQGYDFITVSAKTP